MNESTLLLAFLLFLFCFVLFCFVFFKKYLFLVLISIISILLYFYIPSVCLSTNASVNYINAYSTVALYSRV